MPYRHLDNPPPYGQMHELYPGRVMVGDDALPLDQIPHRDAENLYKVQSKERSLTLEARSTEDILARSRGQPKNAELSELQPEAAANDPQLLDTEILEHFDMPVVQHDICSGNFTIGLLVLIALLLFIIM